MRDDASMIDSPNQWPMKKVLPVKKYGEKGRFPVFGIIVHPDCFPVYVERNKYLIFETDMGNPDFENCPKHQFNSAAELVAAGWMVD